MHLCKEYAGIVTINTDNSPFYSCVFSAWTSSGSEVGDTNLCLSHANVNKLAREKHDLQEKSSEVCIKTWSMRPVSFPFKGQVTEHAI